MPRNANARKSALRKRGNQLSKTIEGMMTNQERMCLEDAKQLDDIMLGMLQPRESVTEKTVQRCVSRGWLRSEPADNPWGRLLTLRTKGLRALARVSH